MTKKTTGATATARRADLVSLFFGILFLAVAGWWAASYFLDLTWTLDLNLPNLGWFVAGGLILLGVIGILSSLRRDRPPAQPPAPAVEDAPEAIPATEDGDLPPRSPSP